MKPRDVHGKFKEKPDSMHTKPVCFRVPKEIREWIDANRDEDIGNCLRECIKKYIEDKKGNITDNF